MRKVLMSVFSLVCLAVSSQLAHSSAPTNCNVSDQRCRAQHVNATVCRWRFNYCAAYNRSLGLNVNGGVLLGNPPGRPGNLGGHGNQTGTAVGSGDPMGTIPGVATATPPAASISTNGGAVTNSGTISTNNGAVSNSGGSTNGRATTNSGVISGRRGSAGGRSGLLSAPGMPRLKAQ
jgi:hypothetical protein